MDARSPADPIEDFDLNDLALPPEYFTDEEFALIVAQMFPDQDVVTINDRNINPQMPLISTDLIPPLTPVETIEQPQAIQLAETHAAPQKNKRKRRSKNTTWIFEDDLEPTAEDAVPDIREKGAFVGDRRVFLQARFYEDPDFKKRILALQPEIPVSALPPQKWVFSRNGQSVPKEAMARKISLAHYAVNDQPIMTWGGFNKRQFRFEDTRALLNRDEKKQLKYDEEKDCLICNNRLVFFKTKTARDQCHVAKKPKIATCEIEPATPTDILQPNNLRAKTLTPIKPLIYSPSNTTTFFVGKPSTDQATSKAVCHFIWKAPGCF